MSKTFVLSGKSVFLREMLQKNYEIKSNIPNIISGVGGRNTFLILAKILIKCTL